MILRMELRTEEPPVRVLDRLDHAVRRRSGHTESIGHPFDGLMVETVRPQRIHTGRHCNKRAFLDTHGMRRYVPRHRLHVTHRSIGIFRRQILIQRSAEGHVDHLYSAANAQHRDLMSGGQFDQPEIERIARRIDMPEMRRRLLAEIGGIDIAAAVRISPSIDCNSPSSFCSSPISGINTGTPPARNTASK